MFHDAKWSRRELFAGSAATTLGLVSARTLASAQDQRTAGAATGRPPELDQLLSAAALKTGTSRPRPCAPLQHSAGSRAVAVRHESSGNVVTNQTIMRLPNSLARCRR
jgi:hypothetical protein